MIEMIPSKKGKLKSHSLKKTNLKKKLKLTNSKNLSSKWTDLG